MKEVILVAISAVVSAIVAWFSAKWAYGNEIKKSVYEKRQKLYVEIYELINKLTGNPYLVFNDSFIKLILRKDAEVNLYASKSVLETIKPIFMNVTSVWQDYNKLYLSEEAIKEKEMRKEGAIRFEGGSAEQFEMDYNQEQEVYMEKNIIAEEKIVCYLKNMSRKMRSELKTK